MRILMIQAGFHAGGAEKVMAGLSSHRHAQGDEVHVAGMAMPEGGSFFPYPDGVRLHLLAAGARTRGGPLLQPRRVLAVARLIRQLRPDLIVSFLTKVNCMTLIAATGTGIPVLISERNNPAAQSSRFWRRLQRRLMPRAAGVAMQTADAAADLLPRQRDRAHIIPNPCRPVAFIPAPPAEHCRFLAVGRLVEQKGFDRLIDAFAALPADLATSLDIFGEGPLERALSARIEARGMAGRIRLAGLASSASDWMGAGDVLVVSSRYEGFSNVLAEATCSGLPAIGFDCRYSIAELIRDGENGLLVPDGDIPALTAAMARIAGNPALRRRLGQSAQLMADRLAPERIMAQWDALIARATRQGRIAQPLASTESS